MNLPPGEEEKMKSDLLRAIINERQRDGDYRMPENSSDSDCPGNEDMIAKKNFLRDKVIYSPDALNGKNLMYVWEDPNSRIHVSDLVIIVMGLLEEDLAREKAKANIIAE